MNRPQLSLCLIIRDEAAMLPEFLASVAGIWDELIAVDTGSADGSVALLESAGAQVSHFRWIDDFAAARNASLELATGRWILFLDADERVDQELKTALASLMEDERAGAATITMRNELPGGHHRDSRLLRLFRNDPAIRFRYRIHEDVAESVHAFLLANNLQLKHLSGRVDHLGYVREVAASRDKKERDLKLLRQALEQDPDDFYCRFKILEIARFWDDTEIWRTEAVASASLLENLGAKEMADLKGRNWSGEMAAMISQGLHADSRLALDWLEKSTPWAGPSAAWWLRRGSLLEELGQTDEAEHCYRHCLTLDQEAASQLVTVRPLLGLVRLCLAKNQLAEAADLVGQAADLAPLDPEALLAVATCAGLGIGPGIMADHLERHPEAAQPMARVLLNTGQITAAQKILLADGHPESDLGLLVCQLALGEDFSGEIGVSQERADELLKSWVHELWQSRQVDSLAAFADNCVSITGVFPWLPDYLAQQTRLLNSSHR